MLTQSYKHTCVNVNKSICLTEIKSARSFARMKFGERLKKAREFAGFTQKQLIDRMGGIMSQQNISVLENGHATGSEFTVQIAMACNVNPEWLATGNGEMAARYDTSHVNSEKIKRAITLMQEMPDYALDEAVKSIDSFAKLAQFARKENKQ